MSIKSIEVVEPKNHCVSDKDLRSSFWRRSSQELAQDPTLLSSLGTHLPPDGALNQQWSSNDLDLCVIKETA
jgi:hypothetical protein